MQKGFIEWKQKKDLPGQRIPLIFTYDTGLKEDIVYWSLDALVSPFIYAKRSIMNIHNYVLNEMTKVRIIKGNSQMCDDHVMIHQYDLELVFNELTKRSMLPKEARTTIMNFLEDVPTPSKPEQSFTHEVSLKEKQEEEPYVEPEDSSSSSSSSGGASFSAEKRKREEYSSEERSSREEEEDNLVEQVLVGTRTINTHLRILEADAKHKIFTNDRERDEVKLYILNLVRQQPRQKVLRFCGDDALQTEPEDDSPLVTVDRRIQQLGYSEMLAPPGSADREQQNRNVGWLAIKYYRELHDGRSPPAIYHTYQNGMRCLITKWTLNNCVNTLDRAIHTIFQPQ